MRCYSLSSWKIVLGFKHRSLKKKHTLNALLASHLKGRNGTVFQADLDHWKNLLLFLFTANKALKAMSLLVSTFFSASKPESFYNIGLMLAVLSLKREEQRKTEMRIWKEKTVIVFLPFNICPWQLFTR